jgi:Restriction endonuclease
MCALENFEAAEANLIKLERLWDQLLSRAPDGAGYGSNPEHNDLLRSYEHVLAHLPKIDGWKPTALPTDLDDVAQNQFDAMEMGEPWALAAVDTWIEAPGRDLSDYRFRLNNKRRALIREALVGLIDQIDTDLQVLRSIAENELQQSRPLRADDWNSMRDHVKQIAVLLGSSVNKPDRWSDMMRHIHFGHTCDLNDIEGLDWPTVKAGLRKGLYGENEPLPVEVDDLGALVEAKPTGAVTVELKWSHLDDANFERLLFSLISSTDGYENADWLMHTRAPDRGRDLSVYRVIKDQLAGSIRSRVVIQCKHWLSKSVRLPEIAAAKEQMAMWNNPMIDVLVVATSGRFTSDAVTWVEKHNSLGHAPKIEMWPESHLELLLAARPGLIAEYKLRR